MPDENLWNDVPKLIEHDCLTKNCENKIQTNIVKSKGNAQNYE